MSLGYLWSFVHVFHITRSFLFWLVFPCIVLARSAPEAFSIWAKIFIAFHSAPGADFVCNVKYFCLCVRSGTVRLREPVLWSGTAWDRSAPRGGFVRNELFCAYGPGPFGSGSWVLFKLSISVYGPGPFGSESPFCLERNIIVFAVRDRSAPGVGIGHIYGPGPFRSGSGLFSGENFLLTRSGTLSAPGAGFIRQNYCYTA